jgi:DNA-binding response OmpR family regulator
MTKFRSRILIVEDEEILAENLRDFLLRRDAEVCMAASTEAALEVVQDFRPAYVVLDYSLPGMNGLDAFSRLKVHAPSMRGLLISGHPTEQLRDRAADAGIEHLLTKPFSFADLERILAEWHADDTPGLCGQNRKVDQPAQSKERRRTAVDARFPLFTPEGWVFQDRRAARPQVVDCSLLASS